MNKEASEEIGEEVSLTIPTTEITTSLDSLQLHDDTNEIRAGKRRESKSNSESSTPKVKLASDERYGVSEIPGHLEERSKDLIGANSDQIETEIRPDDVD